MASSKQQIQSPQRPQRSGSKQLSDSLTKDELLRRLKKIAQELSDAEQGENLEDYLGTVTVLARAFIINHPDKDVRFHASCCLAHVLRIYAPDPPYEKDQLWSIFDLIISQLEGLKNAKGEKGTSYEKLFHLLETLALVKTLIICVQMDFTDLILKFFKIIFGSVRDEHSKKVKNFMLDTMATLIVESESIPQELLDIILENIVNPIKSSNRAAYELASALIKRTITSIEPYVQQFFNDALFFDKTTVSALQDSLYDVLYELYKICPSVLLSVLPQLEFKLKSVNAKERLAVAALLAKMFSDEESMLAQSHKPLWQCFLGRFVDISSDVRVECVKLSKDFFLYQPELVGQISERLLQRQRDTDEKVRLEVVTTICEAASENVSNISQELFDVVAERLRDRKLHIRTDTMMSLGRLYKKLTTADVNNNDKKKVSWIPTKILRCYYQNSTEDRLHVERVFLGCLVPVSLASKERMKRLFTVYQTLDDAGVKAFNHMLKSKASLRSDLNDILRLWEEHQKTSSEEAKTLLTAKISAVARVLPDPSKSQEHLKSLVKMLSDKEFLKLMKICLGGGQDCAKVTKAVSEVVVKFGAKNPMFETIKAILDRTAPLLIDTSAGEELVTLATQCVNGDIVDDDDVDASSQSSEDVSERNEISVGGHKALDLLLACVTVYPTAFKFPLIYEHLLVYLKKGDVLVDFALRILSHIGEDLEEIDSTLYSHYQPVLSKIFTKGKPSQVKLAGRIVSKIYSNSSIIFKRILEDRLKSLGYESSTLVLTLSCISEIALHAPAVFEPHHATVIRDFVVKDLLMKDRDKGAKGGVLWCSEHELSKEIKAKIFGLKILVNWLRGMPKSDKSRAQPVVLMLDKIIRTKGDVTGAGRLRACEMSHMRLAAACGWLKLAKVSVYHEFLEMKYFHNLTSIIKDTCTPVRVKFTKKLSKGLDSLKLPLQYLALFSFYGKEPSKDIKQQALQMLLRNINIRNEYLKQHKTAPEHSQAILPEYALPYLIYTLSHIPSGKYNDGDFLKEIKAYLWFFMECILARGDNYNFMKKLAENIKQTKDANAVEDENINHAMYAVCDIVIAIIMDLSKTRRFMLKDYPADIVLPKKLFTRLDKGERNNKSYLPKDFIVSPVKKTSAGPKITPTKVAGSTGGSSTGKKKTSAGKPSSRVSGKPKGKKVQKSLADMMEKKDSDEELEISEMISDEEREETSERSETRKEKRTKPSAEEEEKEEKFTKVSPRKKVKSSRSEGANKMKNTGSSNKESRTISPEQVVPTKNRQPTAEASVSTLHGKQTKRSSAKTMKEEKPTRFSPRRNQRTAVDGSTKKGNLDETKRTLLKEDFPEVLTKSPMDKRAKDSLGEVAMNGNSQSTSDNSQTDTIVHSPNQSPARKRKIAEKDNHQNPLEQSSLVVKRKRRRR